mmetsp:Transcript_2005/g.2858  ORF Transcript_2005/g.2858 Transcript_2005/m.2858 type:complete len:283 (-) Transcript_2005:139-987(-)
MFIHFRQSSAIACLLLTATTTLSSFSNGFSIASSPANIGKSNALSLLHATPNNKNGESNNSDMHLYRQARITTPLLTALFTTLFSNVSPANAGIGSVIPFEVTRKEKFAGSVTNSVILLRMKATLRKSGYYAKKAVIGTFKPKDDLSVALVTEFGDGRLFNLAEDSSAVEKYVEASNEKPHALILYGQDVDISPSGEVGTITGDDLKTTEKAIMEKLVGKGLKDFTLVGGIVIHRVKTGGKDAGEDCFFPVSITSTVDGKVTDIFPEVFGDLPTPRQTVVLL